MKLDSVLSTIRDLQNAKSQLETQLKQLNVALGALIKLGKTEKDPLESKTQAT